ncbi:MAG: hypothetical protein GX776_09685 [Oxalobacter sp.]|nr:hypothetical protein [Oxalobacter sp.]
MQGNSNQTFMTPAKAEDITIAPEDRGNTSTALSIAFEHAQPGKKHAPSLKKRGVKKTEGKKPEKAQATPGEEQGEAADAKTGELFKKLIEARKASESRLKEQEAEYAALLAIGDVGDTAEDIARQIAYRRFVAEGSKEKLQAALRLLDEQEAALMKRLGMPPREEKANRSGEQPPQARTDTRDAYAAPAQKTEPRKAMPASPPAIERSNLHDLILSAESYFRLYEDEPGHHIRMQHIRQYFRDPAKINEFLAIHEPSSWARQFQYLYDNIIIPSSAYEQKGWDTGSRDDDYPNAPSSTEELIRRNMDRMGL